MIGMDTKAVNIPAEVFEGIQKRVDGSEFTTVDEYVTYVLSQVLEQVEGGEKPPEEAEMSDEDEEKVKERLRALGYIE